MRPVARSGYMSSGQLPDSTTIRPRNILNVADRWAKLKVQYNVKTQYIRDDLNAFTYMHCTAGGNVRAFLGQMRIKLLSTMGLAMTDNLKEN